jgi:hypothetical protein
MEQIIESINKKLKFYDVIELTEIEKNFDGKAFKFSSTMGYGVYEQESQIYVTINDVMYLATIEPK